MEAAQHIQRLCTKNAPPNTAAIARQIETLVNAQVNEVLELLAISISSHVELEDSAEIKAAVCRGSIEQVVIQVSYVARKAFARMARELKLSIALEYEPAGITGTKAKEKAVVRHNSVDNEFAPRVKGSPSARGGNVQDKEEISDEDFWTQDLEGFN